MSLFFQLIVYVVVAYLFIVTFMFFRQESFLFFPPSALHEVHEFQNVQNYSIRQGEISLKGWLVNPLYSREKLLIYFGGNAEDVFLNVDEFSDIQAAALLVAYRGYGPSAGRPSEAGLYSDALAVIDDAVKKYQPKEVYLMGRSLGSGVASFAAAQREVQGVILVTPYDSIEKVAKQVYPWLPVGLLLKHKFASIDYLPRINSPVLILYGGRDEVVRPERTRNLINHISGDSEIVFIDRAEHGTIEMYPEYWEAILRFINRNS